MFKNISDSSLCMYDGLMTILLQHYNDGETDVYIRSILKDIREEKHKRGIPQACQGAYDLWREGKANCPKESGVLKPVKSVEPTPTKKAKPKPKPKVVKQVLVTQRNKFKNIKRKAGSRVIKEGS